MCPIGRNRQPAGPSAPVRNLDGTSNDHAVAHSGGNAMASNALRTRTRRPSEVELPALLDDACTNSMRHKYHIRSKVKISIKSMEGQDE